MTDCGEEEGGVLGEYSGSTEYFGCMVQKQAVGSREEGGGGGVGSTVVWGVPTVL